MKTPALTVSLSVLLAVTSALSAQSAAFTPFGQGCNVQGISVPSIGSRGLPRVGTTFTVLYRGPNSIQPGIGLTDQPTLILGASRVDLPVPLVRVTQPANCVLYPSPDVIVPMPPASGSSFVSELPIRIPNVRVLIGANLFLQWMTPHVQCTFVGCGLIWIAFSDGARAVVGT